MAYALNRYMKVGVNYSFYRYRFDDDASCSTWSRRATSTGRASARSVSFWAPLMNQQGDSMLPGKKYTPDDYPAHRLAAALVHRRFRWS